MHVFVFVSVCCVFVFVRMRACVRLGLCVWGVGMCALSAFYIVQVYVVFCVLTARLSLV